MNSASPCERMLIEALMIFFLTVPPCSKPYQLPDRGSPLLPCSQTPSFVGLASSPARACCPLVDFRMSTITPTIVVWFSKRDLCAGPAVLLWGSLSAPCMYTCPRPLPDAL